MRSGAGAFPARLYHLQSQLHGSNKSFLCAGLVASATIAILLREPFLSYEEGTAGDRTLKLNERISYVLPPEFNIGGVASSETGGVVVWAINLPYLIVLQNGHHQGRE